MKQSEYNGYKMGALKRKFQNGKDDREPGTFISKMNENKAIKQTDVSTLKPIINTAIKGLL